MLDHFGSERPDEYIAGFPDHPHRGFVTLTYMLNGHMLHQDTMGNCGDLRDGGVQWMKAASGVIHSEMPQQTGGLMRGFQLWINLPAREKMTPPAYQEFSAERIPVVNINQAQVKVISGAYETTLDDITVGATALSEAVVGPIHDPNTNMQYLDVLAVPQGRFGYSCKLDHVGFLYLFEGTAQLQDIPLKIHTLVVLAPAQDLEIHAGPQGHGFCWSLANPWLSLLCNMGRLS